MLIHLIVTSTRFNAEHLPRIITHRKRVTRYIIAAAIYRNYRASRHSAEQQPPAHQHASPGIINLNAGRIDREISQNALEKIENVTAGYHRAIVLPSSHSTVAATTECIRTRDRAELATRCWRFISVSTNHRHILVTFYESIKVRSRNCLLACHCSPYCRSLATGSLQPGALPLLHRRR